MIPLRQGLPDGDYTVRWQIVSTDGHLISGVYAIGIGAGRPPPQASSQDSPLDWPYLIARFVYFAGLLLLVGGVVYRVAVYRPAAAAVTGEPRRLMGLRERHRANQVLALSAVLVLAGGWVALTRQGAQVAGRQLLGGVRSPRPGGLGAGRDPLRPPVRARHRRHRGVHDPGRPGLRGGRPTAAG